MLIGHWDWSGKISVDTPQVCLGHRNESSVPRSFILPATPAVALEQERQAKIKERKDLATDGCVEMVQACQQAHGMPSTGYMDERTREMLKCQ